MGNANSGRREQPFLEALRMELKAAGKDMPELRAIARQLIDKAKAGDQQAVVEFANRMDGKPRQAVELTGDLAIEQVNKEQRDAAVAAATRANG